MYKVSNWFGVGYATLIHHMERVLHLLDSEVADELRKAKPYKIRAELLGSECSEHLIVVDSDWRSIPIDLQVSQKLILPPQLTIEGQSIAIVDASFDRTVCTAVTPGISVVRSKSNGWEATVRVERSNFIGRSIYRFLPEV